jgi:hypothetical protein
VRSEGETKAERVRVGVTSVAILKAGLDVEDTWQPRDLTPVLPVKYVLAETLARNSMTSLPRVLVELRRVESSSNIPSSHVLRRLHGFPCSENDFLRGVVRHCKTNSENTNLSVIEWMGEKGEYRLNISIDHVLSGINAKARDALEGDMVRSSGCNGWGTNK